MTHSERPAIGQEEFERLVLEKPKLHFWAGEWQTGGFNDYLLRAMWKGFRSKWPAGGFTSLETGAGLSTLMFLCGNPAKHYAVAPDTELCARLLTECTRRNLSADRLEFITERSEIALPTLVLSRDPFVDLALIDGGHGWPTVFVDFCYIFSALKQGGLLLIDDTQLYSVRELALLLNAQPGIKLQGHFGKLVMFLKTTGERFLPDFGGQPYIVGNSLTQPA
jgi:hypothetical protein